MADHNAISGMSLIGCCVVICCNLRWTDIQSRTTSYPHETSEKIINQPHPKFSAYSMRHVKRTTSHFMLEFVEMGKVTSIEGSYMPFI